MTDLAKLQEERDALAALAEERRQFIVNAVELGYCRLPEPDTPDSAHDTYARCGLIDEAAAALLKAQWQAEALEELGASSFVFDSQELFDRADELRRQAEGAVDD